MSLIYGAVSTTGEQVPDAWQDLMAAPCAGWNVADAQLTQFDGGFFIQHGLPDNAAIPTGPARPASQGASNRGSTSHGTGPHGPATLFDGRIDNRASLVQSLKSGTADTAPDGELIMQAYHAFGPDFISRIIGDFAIALFDPSKRQLLLARDPMGVRPLFFAEAGGFIAFASTMGQLLALPFVDQRPNDVWIVDYLESIKADASSTPYKGIHALAPATCLRRSPIALSQTVFWSAPQVGQPAEIDNEEAIEEFRRLFDQSVACRLPAAAPNTETGSGTKTGNVACELSGGLDSTSVAVTAAPMLAGTGRRLQTFSHVLPADASANLPVKDERREINAVLAKMAPCDHHWLAHASTGQIDCLERTLARHGGPQRRDLNSIGGDLPQAMKDGKLHVLLSGFGGDQLVTSGGAGYWESLAEEKRWDDLAEAASSGRSRLHAQASYWSWRTAPGRAFAQLRIRSAFRRKTKGKPRITLPAAMSDADLLERRLAYPIRPISGTIAARERAIITSPHIGHRLQDSAVGAIPYGFEYRYPMLDIRLVEFCLLLPSRFKRTQHVSRRMIRQAMDGRLPDQVRLRDDKSGSTIPTAFTNHLADLDAYGALYRAHAQDPALTRFVDMERAALANLRAQQTQRFEGEFTKRQLMRIAELCLWSRWQQSNKGRLAIDGRFANEASP